MNADDMQEENLPPSAGLSSFNLLEERKLFDSLGLFPGMTLLDLGCGLGNYAVAASPHVGEGIIHALDAWEEGIETLAVRTEIGRLTNIRACVADAADGPLPLAGSSIDLALLATVAHILVREAVFHKTLAELRRVLRPEGRLAVVEFHKVDVPPGPPVEWRLAPDELADIVAPAGFQPFSCVDVGPLNYLSLFTLRF
ncbi:MAG: class I SAM-dependent methyltransferase [Thermodesulfobacteriota bacterium]